MTYLYMITIIDLCGQDNIEHVRFQSYYLCAARDQWIT